MEQKRLSLKQLKQLLALVDKHKLDSFEIPGLKVFKSRHQYAEKVPSQPVTGSFEPTTIQELDAQIMRDLGVSQ